MGPRDKGRGKDDRWESVLIDKEEVGLKCALCELRDGCGLSMMETGRGTCSLVF